jgi:hypothetical protein
MEPRQTEFSAAGPALFQQGAADGEVRLASRVTTAQTWLWFEQIICVASIRPSAGAPAPITSMPYLRMFTARAATRRTVIAASIDSAAINAFAGRVSGIASVGLKAIALVSDT